MFVIARPGSRLIEDILEGCRQRDVSHVEVHLFFSEFSGGILDNELWREFFIRSLGRQENERSATGLGGKRGFP